MTQASGGDLEELCRAIYRNTAEFYRSIAPGMDEAALGYKILYGPPYPRPPILFVGFQPGGRAPEAARGEAIGERTRWPPRFEYADADWRLAVNARKIWPVEQLSGCVGMNAVFFRSPKVTTWRSFCISNEAEAFCQPHVEALVAALNPLRIVVIGVGTYDKLSRGADMEPALVSSKGRVLVSRGQLWCRPVCITLHLSAQISNEDFGLMRDYFGVRD